MEPSIEERKKVQIKGIGNHLTVLLDPRQPVAALKEELRRIFDPLKHLSANGHVVLDTGDPEGHRDLVQELGAFLKTHYRIETVTEPLCERASVRERWRQKEMEGGLLHQPNEALMMAGRVRSGQKIFAKRHFLLMGDLNPGSEVVAGGDIVILGSLRGRAIAGHPDNDQAMILALDFRPTQIQIGSYVAAGLPLEKAGRCEFAHVQDGTIVVEDYLKANPFGALPWPEIR